MATGRFSLPLVAFYAFAVCLYAPFGHQRWLQLGCLALSALLMVQLNYAFALIRIYSRMVSCSYLMMSVATMYLFPDINGSITQLCAIGFYLCAFQAYQNPYAAGWVFYAFTAVGIASVFFVQALYFVPLLWVLLYTNIQAGSMRTLMAGVLGLMAPYWFIVGYQTANGLPMNIVQHFEQLAVFGALADWGTLNLHEWFTIGFVVLISMMGIIHFLRTSSNDKIRTRIFYETFITVALCTLTFMILQPQHRDALLKILMMNTAPLIGHFLALTHTKLTNICFVVMTVAAILLTAFNLWIQ